MLHADHGAVHAAVSGIAELVWLSVPAMAASCPSVRMAVLQCGLDEISTVTATVIVMLMMAVSHHGQHYVTWAHALVSALVLVLVLLALFSTALLVVHAHYTF